jgi:hypothetical protein
MASTEWYYAHDGQQAGPVSAVELKQLADAGKLRPDDLVWQEGVKDWIPARKVKGLFDAKQVAAAAPTVTAPPVVAAPSKGVDRPPSGIDRIAVSDRPPVERGADRPSVTVTSPVPAEPTGPRPHPVEGLLAAITRNTGRSFVEAAAVLFTRAGQWGIYAAMLGSVGLGAAFAVTTRNYTLLAAQLVVLPALVVVQFASRRLLDACTRLAHTGGAKLGSSALLETVALVAMLAGLVSLAGMTVVAVQWRLLWVAFPGLAGFIVLEYLAIVALNPDALDLAIDPDAELSEEAVGVLAFMVMALARLAPVLWGVGVLWAAAEVILAAVAVFAHNEALWPALGGAAVALTVLVLAPLWVYLKLLVYHLLLSLLRAVWATPERLERIADRADEG